MIYKLGYFFQAKLYTLIKIFSKCYHGIDGYVLLCEYKYICDNPTMIYGQRAKDISTETYFTQ